MSMSFLECCDVCIFRFAAIFHYVCVESFIQFWHPPPHTHTTHTLAVGMNVGGNPWLRANNLHEVFLLVHTSHSWSCWKGTSHSADLMWTWESVFLTDSRGGHTVFQISFILSCYLVQWFSFSSVINRAALLIHWNVPIELT